MSEGEASRIFLGSDKCDELRASGQLVDMSVEDVVPMNCRLAFMCMDDEQKNVEEKLDAGGEGLTVATSYPNLLKKYAAEEGLDIVLARTVEGGVEAFGRTAKKSLRTDMVFDIVNTGDTQRDNTLVVCRETGQLQLNVIDALTLCEQPNVDELRMSIRAVAATYAQRAMQAQRPPDATDSYTVQLLRSRNRLTKKFGEESAEFLQAVLRAEPTTDELISEGADMLYVMGLWLARNGVSIEDVIDEDIRRNNPDEEGNTNE